MTDTVDAPATQVTFIEYHRPAMPPGRYSVEVRQDVTGRGVADSFGARRRFTVAGDRLALNPGDVFAVFPPENSLGDHSDVLPHVLLTRSTLPWEFTADAAGTPWLALLVLDERETLAGTLAQETFLREFAGADAAATWAHLLDERVGWLRPLSATPGGALVVAHSQRAAAELGDAFAPDAAAVEAVLDRHRTPQVVTVAELRAATAGPVHWPGLAPDVGARPDIDKVTVIDVEKRLLARVLPTAADLRLLTHVRRAQDADGHPFDDDRAAVLGNRLPPQNGISVAYLVSVQGRYTDGRFGLDGVADGDYVRLVSLKSWRFACVDPAGDFSGLLTGLDREPSGLRLPRNADPEVERHLSAGHVPLPHRSRASGTTVSWYRGPLVPSASPADIALPAQSADALALYDPALGMFDVSYASAWELGRLLAVQSTQLSSSLYSWKRTHAQALQQAQAWILHPEWMTPDPDADQLPADVVGWFDQLRLLHGVPFDYLVADDRMLPPESIRFVQLNQPWIDCLVDGAFSIGRLTGALKEVDHQQRSALAEALPEHPTTSGFLMRSSVVAGWPGLVVDAYGPPTGGARGPRLPVARIDRLAPDLLLCLFSGQVARVDVHQKPETLHFGTGHLTGGWLNAARVVDVGALAATIRVDPPLASSDLAAKVIEGVPRVSFVVE
jgi:hypothetical protein